jgi:hypothetical protein
MLQKTLLDTHATPEHNRCVDKPVQVRVPERTRDMANVAAAKLRIPLIEFLRRAVEREIEYNDQRVKTK